MLNLAIEEVIGKNQTIDFFPANDNVTTHTEMWDFQTSSLKSELMSAKLDDNLSFTSEKQLIMTELENSTTETVPAHTSHAKEKASSFTTPEVKTTIPSHKENQGWQGNKSPFEKSCFIFAFLSFN